MLLLHVNERRTRWSLLKGGGMMHECDLFKANGDPLIIMQVLHYHLLVAVE